MRFNCLKISRATPARLGLIVHIVDSRRLGKIATASIAQNEKQVNQKGDSCYDANCTGGANEIHASCIWWPVVALLCVAPVLQDDDRTCGEQCRSNDIEDGQHSPREAEIKDRVKKFIILIESHHRSLSCRLELAPEFPTLKL